MTATKRERLAYAKTPPTTGEIESWIMSKRGSAGIACPGYYAPGWWECDVCCLTKAGYWHEYEVKVSRTDFARDALKSSGRYNKHQLLSEGAKCGPNCFWFCAPQGLIGTEEVPAWAGLLEFRRLEGWPLQLACTTTKRAPRLHSHIHVGLEARMHECAAKRYMYDSIQTRDNVASQLMNKKVRTITVGAAREGDVDLGSCRWHDRDWCDWGEFEISD